jgi:hypothetical protein
MKLGPIAIAAAFETDNLARSCAAVVNLRLNCCLAKPAATGSAVTRPQLRLASSRSAERRRLPHHVPDAAYVITGDVAGCAITLVQV